MRSVLVCGTGAMASLVGARLARSGRAGVTLVGTWTAALEAVARCGLIVESEDGRWSVPVAVTTPDHPPPRADLVLVLVKSHQTEAVSRLAAAALAPGGLVLTLQNGLGSREILERAAPGRVAQGTTTAGATLLAPGVVREAASGATVVERAPGSLAAAELFQASGLPCLVADDVECHLWRKLAVNCAVNALTTLHGVPNGRLLERTEWRSELQAAAGEVAAVAAARGLDLGPDLPAHVLDVVALTARNRSSMLQDVERGARTEVDAINGAVVLEGRRLGVPTPVNRRLWARVRSLELARASAPAGARP